MSGEAQPENGSPADVPEIELIIKVSGAVVEFELSDIPSIIVWIWKLVWIWIIKNCARPPSSLGNRFAKCSVVRYTKFLQNFFTAIYKFIHCHMIHHEK